MFGRVRASSLSSLELLELQERQPPKVTKHDSLSVYETTIVKLKQGSRLDLSSCPDDYMSSEASTSTNMLATENVVPIDTDSSRPAGSPKEQAKRNVSVAYLFSRYKSSRQALNSPSEDVMEIENGPIARIEQAVVI